MREHGAVLELVERDEGVHVLGGEAAHEDPVAHDLVHQVGGDRAVPAHAEGVADLVQRDPLDLVRRRGGRTRRRCRGSPRARRSGRRARAPPTPGRARCRPPRRASLPRTVSSGSGVGPGARRAASARAGPRRASPPAGSGRALRDRAPTSRARPRRRRRRRRGRSGRTRPGARRGCPAARCRPTRACRRRDQRQKTRASPSACLAGNAVDHEGQVVGLEDLGVRGLEGGVVAAVGAIGDSALLRAAFARAARERARQQRRDRRRRGERAPHARDRAPPPQRPLQVAFRLALAGWTRACRSGASRGTGRARPWRGRCLK